MTRSFTDLCVLTEADREFFRREVQEELAGKESYQRYLAYVAELRAQAKFSFALRVIHMGIPPTFDDDDN